MNKGELRNPDVLKVFMTFQGSFQAEHSRFVPGLGSAEAPIGTVYVAPESRDASHTASSSARRSPSTSGTVMCLPRGSTPKCTISGWG